MSVRADAIALLGGPTDGPLHIGGLDAEALASRFGTPLYVYDAGVVRRRLREVRAALGPEVAVLYALKANPSVAVARIMREQGARIEVASAGEVLVARAAGFAGADLQLAGPGKGPLERRAAAEHGVARVSVESEDELDAWLDSAVLPDLLLRADLPLPGARPRLGHSGKFGLDADAVVALAARCAREPRCRLVGLHTNAGTQGFDAAAWAGAAGQLAALADRVEREAGVRLAELNVGGGFGVPYADGDRTFDLASAGTLLSEALAGSRRRHAVELGRYLVAPCGVYLTRVIAVKQVRGERFAIVDGGLHHHGAAAGVGAVLRRPFPVVACRAPVAAPGPPLRIGGPLCTSADELLHDGTLPALEPGDLLAVLQSGAYGLTFSQALFLGHPTPAEVLVDGGEARIVRDAGTPADALRGQRVP